MKRAALLALLAMIALSGCGGYTPVISETEVELAVGETHPMSVTARCMPGYYGSCGPPNFRWHFESANPAIATADVVVESRGSTPFDLTGIAPGKTTLLGPGRDYAKIRVHCASEPSVLAATPLVHAHIGESVDLVAVSPIANRMVFAWYEGRSGDTSRPLDAGGDTLRFTPAERGTQYVWVHASTPCSTSSAEFRIDSDIPRRRAVRR